MQEEIIYMSGIVAAGFAVNFFLRALPFVLFPGRNRQLPRWISRFSVFVSPVIIAALVVYSYSDLQWRTAWPYLAGALTVSLQLWRRNPLVSIVAGTVLYMCLINCGCTTASAPLEISAAHPSIRISTTGVLIGNNYVEPADIPDILEDYNIPRNRVIHILIDPEVERNLKPVRNFMGFLASRGYRRTVLVTKKRSESAVVTEEQRMERERRNSSVYAPSHPRRANTGRIRYKGADE